MTQTGEIVKKGRKFQQVLDGARQVFMTDGFEGASVDEIAKTARVSKATLYSYFHDKRALFSEVARAECRLQADRAVANIDTDAPAEQVLRAAGQHMVNFMLSDFGQRVYRICVAEADLFPNWRANFTTPDRASPTRCWPPIWTWQLSAVN